MDARKGEGSHNTLDAESNRKQPLRNRETSEASFHRVSQPSPEQKRLFRHDTLDASGKHRQ